MNNITRFFEEADEVSIEALLELNGDCEKCPAVAVCKEIEDPICERCFRKWALEEVRTYQ